MSYYQNQQPGGGYPPYQGHSPAPSQSYAPPPSTSPYPQQQGWSPPPPPMQNQYPPPQGYPPSGYPPQQGYQPPQQPYGAPPTNYPPPNPQYPPPQQGWGQQPPMQVNQYPPQTHPTPPQAYPPYGAPPAQYPPPHQAPYNTSPSPAQPYGMAPPPLQPYGAPPPGPYGPPPGATPPSLGYGPQQTAQINVNAEVEALYKAMKGFGTNDKELIKIISKQDPIRMNTIRQQFSQRFMKDLVSELHKETSGHYRDAVLAIARGPLTNDAWALNAAMKGMGTDEAMLNDVLVGRSNADINAIKAEYSNIFKKSLESDLREDLSAATEQLFVMIVAARRNEDSAPVIHQEIEQNVTDLQRAIGNMISKDSVQTCQILTTKNDAQLRAISQAYLQRFHKSLESTIKSKFSGHMEDALVLLLARANNRVMSDAVQLEESMAGLGTKDDLLLQRVVRAHWDRQHMQQVKIEYKNKYRKDLIKRIQGETSGSYEKLLVACCE